MDTQRSTRRGRRSSPVDEKTLESIRAFVARQEKVSAAADMLGVSVSTLRRLLSGEARFIATHSLSRILVCVGSVGPQDPPPPKAMDRDEVVRAIGRAMYDDARGDHVSAGGALARIRESDLDLADQIGLRLARARNAAHRGDGEAAESLLVGVIALLRRDPAQRVTLARAWAQLASVRASRQKVADALVAFRSAERILLEAGVGGVPHLQVVRQAFLGYALRIGQADEAQRLLRANVEAAVLAEGAHSHSARFDSWLRDALSGNSREPDHDS